MDDATIAYHLRSLQGALEGAEKAGDMPNTVKSLKTSIDVLTKETRRREQEPSCEGDHA